MLKLTRDYQEISDFITTQPNIQNMSCLTDDEVALGKLEEDLQDGDITYLLVDEGRDVGYIRVIDLGKDWGAIDMIFPRKLSDSLEHYLDVFRQQGYEQLFLNYGVPWVRRMFDEEEVETRHLTIPDKHYLKHFRDGSATYELVDILDEDAWG